MPGILLHTDLPQIAASLAPRRVCLAGAVEAAGDRVEADKIRSSTLLRISKCARGRSGTSIACRYEGRPARCAAARGDESAPTAEVEIPRPGPRDVLLRVHACGVCRTDLHVTEGELPPRKSPIIPGHQVVGIVEQAGAEVTRFRRGDRAGIAWLHSTDGSCRFCRSGRENLCDNATFTGWMVDGGYAEFALGDERFVYPIPPGFPDLQAAPLLCAGIIGFRALRLSGIARGGRLGIYGFGAAGHVCIQVARHWGAEVYVMTRHARHQQLAAELGADWVGGRRIPRRKSWIAR